MPAVHRNRVRERRPAAGLHRLRRVIQVAFAVFFNGYAVGFAKGSIFKGASKAACVPVLNCYSCPGALGSCPIGALQTALGGQGRHFPFYVLGTLMLFGVLFGRLICGLACPFGLVQELLHKVPVPKLHVPARLDQALRWVKYVMLFGVVVLLSVALTSDMGTTDPLFCEYICPAGTLEAGIPLLLTNPPLRALVGFLFSWKMLILVVILMACLFIHRPFCKYLCPLGALYGLFNKFSFYRMRVDASTCTHCGSCQRVCPMGVDASVMPNSAECIRCGTCRASCPHGAIVAGYEWSLTPEKDARPEEESVSSGNSQEKRPPRPCGLGGLAVFSGGDACESNTPVTFCAPCNGFEDRGDHQASSISICSLVHVT